MRREADAELLQRHRREPAALGIKKSIATLAGCQRFLEQPRGRFERIEQAELLLVGALILRVGLRHGNASLAREPLNGFREAQALRLHDEGEDIAVLARGEAMIEGLLVVDGEGRRLLFVERRQAFPFATGALQRHAARNHLRDRQPGPDLIEERIGELHRSQ